MNASPISNVILRIFISIFLSQAVGLQSIPQRDTSIVGGERAVALSAQLLEAELMSSAQNASHDASEASSFLSESAVDTSPAGSHDPQALRFMSSSTDVGNVNALMWSPRKLDNELDRIFKDVLAMEEVRRTFPQTNLQIHTPQGSAGKVAYMFMVKDGLDQHDLWWKYFSVAKNGTYSIYFHQYAPNSMEAKTARDQWTTLGAQFIPLVKSQWCQLAGVEFGLMWEAMRDPSNAQFMLLSEGTVPLKSAQYTYDSLMITREDSKLCFAMPKDALYLLRGELNGQCTYKDVLQSAQLQTSFVAKGGQRTMKEVSGRVRKHHQWVVLARRHVVDVLQNGEDAIRRYLSAVTRVYSGTDSDPALLGCSDESFVGTALLLASEKRGGANLDSDAELRHMGVRNECTTFVYWRHCLRRSPLGGLGGLGSTWKEIKFLGKRFIANPRKFTHDITDPRKTPLKKWNDTPRNFGLTDAQPSPKYLHELVHSGMLFARKFGKDEHGKLSRDFTSDLPVLWTAWEASFAHRVNGTLKQDAAIWPYIDTGDEKVMNTTRVRWPHMALLQEQQKN